jgi:hypothetical protein
MIGNTLGVLDDYGVFDHLKQGFNSIFGSSSPDSYHRWHDRRPGLRLLERGRANLPARNASRCRRYSDAGCSGQVFGLANFPATGGRHTGLTIKTSGRSVTVQLSWPSRLTPRTGRAEKLRPRPIRRVAPPFDSLHMSDEARRSERSVRTLSPPARLLVET